MNKLYVTDHFWIIAIFSIILTSCSTKYKIIEENGSKKMYNIKYGARQQQRMDVFLPANYPVDAPAVLVVHGGSWTRGNKARMRMIQNFLFDKGMVTININYRLLKKKDTYENQIEDISLAVAKSNELSKTWNILPHQYTRFSEKVPVPTFRCFMATEIRRKLKNSFL